MSDNERAWHNAYLYHAGLQTEDDMLDDETYLFPEQFNMYDYEPTLKYFEGIEDYEKCQNIIEAAK